MTFDLNMYHAFVKLLYEHPELRAEVRQLVLSEEILTLPQLVRELAEAQKRTDEQLQLLTQRVDALTQRLDALTQRVDALTQRVDALTQRVEELAEAQKRTEQRVEELAEAQKRTEQRVEELAEAQKRTEQRVEELAEAQVRMRRQLDVIIPQFAEMRGDTLEVRYRQRIFSYFGRLASRVRVVDLQDIWEEIVPHLSEAEQDDLLELDLLASGRLKASWQARAGGIAEVWFAVEISGKVNANDVKRARERANLLKKAGLPVVAVAAGREKEDGIEALSRASRVVLQTDGQLQFVEEALEVIHEQVFEE